MVSTVAGAIINIILNFVLIPIYGGFGAAIATVISYIVVTIVRVIDVRKKVRLDIQWWRVFVQIFMVILMMFFETFVQVKWVYIFEMICLLSIVLSDSKLIKHTLNIIKLRRCEKK